MVVTVRSALYGALLEALGPDEITFGSRVTGFAVTLGQALDEGASVADALQAYERERLPKTAVLVAQGRRTARVMRAMNPIACGISEVAIRLAPVELFLKLYVRINRRAGTDVTRAA